MNFYQRLIVSLAILVLGISAYAADESPFAVSAPFKAPTSSPSAIPSGDGLRQGGDTIADAIAVEVGQTYTGSTIGYADDYDEACPYGSSTSPDVVYSLIPQFDECLTFDLAGSSFDTKIYIYDEDLTLITCNDDYYPDYVSKIGGILLAAGTQYFVVIDGFGGYSGDYQLAITALAPCSLDCGDWAYHELEPPLADDYIDTYNGGCNSIEHTGDPVLQELPWYGFCATTGWYGVNSRDTDWFTLLSDPSGYTTITMDADILCRFFVLEPGICDDPVIIEEIEFGPCDQQEVTLQSEPDHQFWFVVVPDGFTPPENSDCFGDGEYNYLLYVDGYEGTAVETRSLSAVKGLFH